MSAEPAKPGPSGFLDSRLQAIQEIVRTTYEHPSIVSRYTTVGLWPAEEILILDFVPEGARILDLGCGAGRTSVALAAMGLEVVGIDISDSMVQAAREQARLADVSASFQVMNTMALDFPDNSFDVALYSYNGIELLPGVRGKRLMFEEVARVLRPEGRLIFSSHSSFAVNAYAAMRLSAFLKLCAGRLLGVPVRERELGERFIDADWEEAKYLQILPPSMLKRMAAAHGLETVYFNTRGRIESGRNFGFRGHFEDGERFYVCQAAST
jgi:ubiquinone/menaquinone biosynthesis C-methylase UbiE